MTYRHLCGVLLLAVGCGPEVAEAPLCLNLSQPDGDRVTTTQPGKVSAFFSVDTCAGQPVSTLTGDDFDILEDGKAVSPYESRRTVRPKGQHYQMDSLVLLDFSGSILRSNSWRDVHIAASRYIDTVLAKAGDGQRVALYTFDGRANPQQVVGFTGDKAAAMAGLHALMEPQCETSAQCVALGGEAKTCAGRRCVDDSTNLNGAVVKAIDALEAESAAARGIAFKDATLVVFTDGTDQAARMPASTVVSRTKDTSAHVFTVGLGAEVDRAALETYGKNGFYEAGNPDQLADAFDRVAQKVKGLANRFYLLEYCSPKRSGKHELKVVARWASPQGPLAGSLTREFDATGFESGCDLTGE